MANLCIIPARGGSKILPRKNIGDFLGKPIISYSIEVALNCGLFNEVMVSTDDDEITKISKRYGAKVPFLRSKKNSDDFATTMDVISEVQICYKNILGLEFRYICCIYPTAPLVKVRHIFEGLAKLKECNLTSVLPVVPFSYPIWRGFEVDNKNEVKMIWPEFVNKRTQDLKKVYHDAGQWYWFNSEKLANWEWPNNSGSIILSELNAQDIDTITDWKLAEMKYKLNHKRTSK